MKKKILFTVMLLASVFAFAKKWIVTTSCGTTATLTTADNVTTNQLTEYVQLVNYDECGVIPKHVIINP